MRGRFRESELWHDRHGPAGAERATDVSSSDHRDFHGVRRYICILDIYILD
jgi:hypothetical protein